jgi:hypothetical protein
LHLLPEKKREAYYLLTTFSIPIKLCTSDLNPRLFKGHDLTLKILKNKPLSKAEQWKADELIA